ncbi:hypothetical protein C8R41DRAFT_937735 [Lentinula lateritia]|uniref:HNH nuclease domain-containing protein n=1 Tax=Lentinula lateritia TaxID=40482 RepID=A0ABQ8VVI6_9AGAR|nr:hypothetical protein C8R41DRAFT_937735 [Lentinula lateritia]
MCILIFCTVRSSNKVPTPRSIHPSRQSFTRLEDMLAQTMEASGNDYQTAREKALARDGYQCMITGVWDTNSLERNIELNELLVKSRGYEATVQTCHILSQSIMQGIGDSRRPSSGVIAILTQFHLGHLVDVLVEKGGVHSLCNLLSLVQPLHEAFDRLGLWFDETDEDDMYEVRVVRDSNLGTFSHVNRQPHFEVNEMLKKPKFRHVQLALPDSRFLALHAVCARVAHMSGAAE